MERARESILHGALVGDCSPRPARVWWFHRVAPRRLAAWGPLSGEGALAFLLACFPAPSPSLPTPRRLLRINSFYASPVSASAQGGAGGSLRPPVQETPETWVRSPGREDPLTEETARPAALLPGESHGQRNPVGYSPWRLGAGHGLAAEQQDCSQRLGREGFPSHRTAVGSELHTHGSWIAPLPSRDGSSTYSLFTTYLIKPNFPANIKASSHAASPSQSPSLSMCKLTRSFSLSQNPLLDVPSLLGSTPRLEEGSELSSLKQWWCLKTSFFYSFQVHFEHQGASYIPFLHFNT